MLSAPGSHVWLHSHHQAHEAVVTIWRPALMDRGRSCQENGKKTDIGPPEINTCVNESRDRFGENSIISSRVTLVGFKKSFNLRPL